MGYDGVDIPASIKDMDLEPCVDTSNLKKDSLLFITDKVSGNNETIDINKLNIRPAAIVISKARKVSDEKIPIIRAKSVRAALSFALSNFCGIDYDKIKIIGVTGTNGKTTTATLIYEMLRISGYKVGFIGTGRIISDGIVLSADTYSMTTPDPMVLYPTLEKMIDKGCKFVVMEVSSHALALDKTAPIKFEYGIFTNLGNDHLDFHQSKDEYFKTKLKLFSSVKVGLFNIDDEYSMMASNISQCKKRTFGIINEADAYATEIDISDIKKTVFFYRENGIIFKVESHIGGAFNVYNILAALKCVIDLGIKPCIAKNAISKIHGIEGRMEITDGPVRIIIDYAHTPEAFYNSLKTIKQSVNSKQRLVLVFGCGGDRDKGKRHIFGKIADEFADTIIITEDNPRSENSENIANDILSGIEKKSAKIIHEREKAIRYAFAVANHGDVIALIGKGHERYTAKGGKLIYFDERKIAAEEMSKWK